MKAIISNNLVFKCSSFSSSLVEGFVIGNETKFTFKPIPISGVHCNDFFFLSYVVSIMGINP